MLCSQNWVAFHRLHGSTRLLQVSVELLSFFSPPRLASFLLVLRHDGGPRRRLLLTATDILLFFFFFATLLDRPFLSTSPQDNAHPAFTDGPFSIAPLSPFKSPRLPQRSHTTPLNLETTDSELGGDLPSFTRSASAGGTRMWQSPPLEVNNNQHARNPSLLSAEHNDPDPRPAETSPDLEQLRSFTHSPPSANETTTEDEERQRRRSRAMRHRREASIDSKAFQRLSIASGRWAATGGLPSPISPDAAAVPPLPPMPSQHLPQTPSSQVPEQYRFETPGESENDGNTNTSPQKHETHQTGLDDLKFGFAARTASPEPVPSETHLRSESNGQENQQQNTPSYHLDGDFSVSNFVRGLGVNDAYHTPNESTSSNDSSTSEAPSGGSFSSRPSETSSVSEPKSAMSLNHDKPLPPLEEPPKPYQFDLESPTDPFFQHGRLSLLPPSRNTSEETARPPPLPEAPPPVPVPAISPPPRSTTPKSRRSRCRGCQEIITGKSVSSADGRLTGRYHKACFVCHVCRAPFQTADFYVLENNPYCAQHYHQLNGSLCAACDHGIEGPCLQTEELVEPEHSSPRNQKYHPSCFKCRTCRIVLRGDYFEWDGHVYCERDGRRAAAIACGSPPSPGFPPSPQMMRPPPPRGYGRPPFPSSPLAGPRGGDPRLRAPGPSPSSLAPIPQARIPPPNRRFPERRTTKLMMI